MGGLTTAGGHRGTAPTPSTPFICVHLRSYSLRYVVGYACAVDPNAF